MKTLIKKINIAVMISASMLFSCTTDIKAINKSVNSSNIHKDSIQLFVTGIDGRSSVLEVNPAQTIYSVKNKIQDIIGFSPKAQRIMSGKTQLQKDDLSLREYGILEDSFLQLHLNINGGTTQGPDIKKSPVKVKLQSGGPSWASVYDGLNIAISCENDRCPTKKSNYNNWVHIGGKKEYSLSTLVFRGIVCTACGTKTKDGKRVRGYGFRNCNYKIEGRHHGKDLYNDEFKYIDIDEVAPSGELFKHMGHDWVWWNALVITIY